MRVFTLAMLIAAGALSGCVATTDFVDQSSAYNVSAGDTNDQQLLLNIIRSSYNRPTEFTAIQTATGTNMLQGGLSLSSALSSIATPTGMGTTSGSISSAISNTVLDTREFISGMRTAVPPTVINDYFQESYSRAILFNLFFDRIILWSNSKECRNDQHNYKCEYSFNNNPRDPRQFALFQTMMRYLLGLGFTMETTKTLPADPKKPDDNKAPDGAHFCFRPRTDADNENVPAGPAQCSPSGVVFRKPLVAQPVLGLGILLNTNIITAMENAACRNPLPPEPEPHDPDDTNEYLKNSLTSMKDKGKVAVALRVRSPLAIIEYLGSVVSYSRRTGQIAKVDVNNPPLVNGNEQEKDFSSCVASQDSCTNIFTVYNNIIDPTGISVNYNGLQHTIPGDPRTARTTYYIMSIVRQLIALSLSAKDLPAPAVLTLVQ